ncbi:MAG: metallophosphoesterase, partial [Spirochaetes bacterium]|nr:metallophosphoesterase [Spirochaetota bacterium]
MALFIELVDYFFNHSEIFPLTNQSKLVIFSDLHIGNGKKADDFKENSDLFLYILDQYYFKKDFSLYLNGDIEELQKFHLDSILKYWKELYLIFDRFHAQQKLFKLVGNHDDKLWLQHKRYPLYHSLKLCYRDMILFIFHGHQLSQKYYKYSKLLDFVLRYGAQPLGIKNYSVAHNSSKQFKIEKLAYQYSVNKKIISIIGHTHRPLFESLSKAETLGYQIEHWVRHFHDYDEKT